MNIGILIPGFSANEDGWAIPIHQHLVRELSQKHDVRVIALRYPHITTPYSIYNATVYPLGVGAWVRGWRRIKLWRDATNLLQQLHQEKPFDVLHAMWGDETGLIGTRAGKRFKIPSVVSIAGGELIYLSDIQYGLQGSWFSRWTVKQALSGASAVVVACAYTKNLLKNILPTIAENTIYTIPLGVDTDVFYPATDNALQKKLIHVGSLIPVKDQEMLLKAVAKVDHVELKIIGKGILRNHLEERTQQLGIHNRVQFVGNVHHLQLREYYHQASLHILTSKHEALGMVTLEAAACGIPTISTNVGIAPDYNELGMAVPVGDNSALAETIEMLLSDEPRRQQLSTNANNLIQNQLTIQHSTEKLLQLYEGLLN